MPAGIPDTVVELVPKGLPNEKNKPPTTANNSISPELRWTKKDD